MLTMSSRAPGPAHLAGSEGNSAAPACRRATRQRGKHSKRSEPRGPKKECDGRACGTVYPAACIARFHGAWRMPPSPFCTMRVLAMLRDSAAFQRFGRDARGARGHVQDPLPGRCVILHAAAVCDVACGRSSATWYTYAVLVCDEACKTMHSPPMQTCNTRRAAYQAQHATARRIPRAAYNVGDACSHMRLCGFHERMQRFPRAHAYKPDRMPSPPSQAGTMQSVSRALQAWTEPGSGLSAPERPLSHLGAATKSQPTVLRAHTMFRRRVLCKVVLVIQA